MKIRAMTQEDLRAVWEIEKLSFALPCSLEALDYELNQNQFAHYLVMELQNEVIAYGGLWLILDEAHVINIAVKPDFRGQGWGRKLLEKMLELSQSSGAAIIWLEVRPSNQPARQLYSSLGFKPVGLRAKYYTDNGENAIVMAKKFDSQTE
ncbi:MAG: ribosomal protein S18-alanine N-acetyltransferase [Clostridia bacterium]|nr:ribosomal protein S18-alanine N-acetyltransferase [Clostridia bacterium]